MAVLKIDSFRGGISDYEDKGGEGAFKFAKNADIRRIKDTLTANQALMDIGDLVTSSSISPSASRSPSASVSPSNSPSRSPSASISPTNAQFSPSASKSPSASRSPSASLSPSASRSPSSSISFSPSPTSGLTTVFQDLVKFWVAASDGYTYGFGNTGKIYQVASDLTVKLVYNQGQEIKGAEEEPASGGARYLIWATNTELHRKQLFGNASWNDVDAGGGWPKQNLTGDVPHTMKQINGAVEIANGSSLAYVGYDQSYTNNALDIIPGNIINTIIERSSRGIYGVYPSGYPYTGVNAAIDTEIPTAQIGNDGELFIANMADFVPAKRFPGGGRVNPGGVSAAISKVAFFEWDQLALSYIDKQRISNLSLWGVYNASSGYNGVYSYGRKYKNHPICLNLEYNLEVDEIGAVIVNNGNTLISYRSGSDFGVKAVDPNAKATFSYYSLDFKTPVKAIDRPTVWEMAELYMQPLPAGCSVEFWYRTNKNGNFIQAKTANGQTSFSTTGGEKAVFTIGSYGEVFEHLIVGKPSGNNSPEIIRDWIYFNV